MTNIPCVQCGVSADVQLGRAPGAPALCERCATESGWKAPIAPPPAPALAASPPAAGGDGWASPGYAPAPPPPPPHTVAPQLRSAAQTGQTDVAMGLLMGVAAATLGGLAWYLVVSVTHFQITFLAVGVGWFTAQGVLFGARRGGKLTGALAAMLTLLAVVVSQYFITRSFLIHGLKGLGAPGTVPLWRSFDWAYRLIRAAMKDSPLIAIFWAVAVVAAFVTGANNQRSAFDR